MATTTRISIRVNPRCRMLSSLGEAGLLALEDLVLTVDQQFAGAQVLVPGEPQPVPDVVAPADLVLGVGDGFAALVGPGGIRFGEQDRLAFPLGQERILHEDLGLAGGRVGLLDGVPVPERAVLLTLARVLR